MAMNGTDLASTIRVALDSAGKYAGLSTAQKDAIEADMAIVYGAMVTYIVANMEINGVQMSTGTALLNSPTPLVPVPTDGGAAVSAQMVANIADNTITQNNGGTGLVT